MSLFGRMKLFCPICGSGFTYDGSVASGIYRTRNFGFLCSEKCFKASEMKDARMILGKDDPDEARRLAVESAIVKAFFDNDYNGHREALTMSEAIATSDPRVARTITAMRHYGRYYLVVLSCGHTEKHAPAFIKAQQLFIGKQFRCEQCAKL